ARLRPLVGDPALGYVHPRAVAGPAGRADPCGRWAVETRSSGGFAGRGLARRDLSRGAHGRAGALCPLQGRGPVVPQLDGAGAGAARPADFRFPAVQQELQPVVLRARFVRIRHAVSLPGTLETGTPHYPLPRARPVIAGPL